MSIIACGSYVEEDSEVPSGEVWAGSPAKKLRDLKPAEKDYLRSLPTRYTEMGAQHKEIADLMKQKQADYSHTH
jgi:carbonic anhydrase/acetyltransferase-like protein (isoleucine patch superfamily)